MKQLDPNTWASSLDNAGTIYVYTTLSEAQTKLEELQANNPTGIQYMIYSYPEGSEI
jgi:hypothetical protein